MARANGFIFETNGQPARRLDSADVKKDNTFTLTSQIPTGGGVFLLNIANAQRMALLLEGGETLNVIADGFATDLKTGKKGNGPNNRL